MLNKIILGAPLWLWIIGFIVIYMLLNEKDSEKFTQDIEKFTDNKKTKVFNFNTLWCGWSKKFQPEWDKFSESVKTNPNIEAIDVKCDNPENEQMCKDYDVPGFPYIVVEKNNVKTSYDGQRTSEAMLKNI
jgi:thiol-disulfide isomerase/thioredoxin